MSVPKAAVTFGSGCQMAWPSCVEKDCSSAPETAQAGRKALEEPEPQAAHATGQTDRQGAGEKKDEHTATNWGHRDVSYEVIGEEKPEGRTSVWSFKLQQ